MREQFFGTFLTFEGIEGAGKTTQLACCEAYLKKQGVDCLVTREPGGTKVGELIRAILLDPATRGLSPRAELLLFNASRVQHLEEVILPALAGGKLVLCDRYLDSSVAYQGFGRGLGPETALELCLSAVDGILPDRTFWLDLDMKSAVGRAQRREEDSAGPDASRFEHEALPFHHKVMRGFEWSAQRDPARFVRIDANGTELEVFSRIRPHLDELCQLASASVL